MSITSLSFNLVSHLNVQNFLSDDQILSLWVPSVSLLFHVRYYAVDVGIKINKIICCQLLSYIYIYLDFPTLITGIRSRIQDWNPGSRIGSRSWKRIMEECGGNSLLYVFVSSVVLGISSGIVIGANREWQISQPRLMLPITCCPFKEIRKGE